MDVTIVGTAVLVAGLALAGPAGAQGFSGSGAAGVAALRGTTASPGYGFGDSGSGAGGAFDGPVALAPEPAGRHRRRMAPTDVEFAPRRGPSDAVAPPF